MPASRKRARAEIAERFALSVSFVHDVRRRVRESGSAAAKAHSVVPPRPAPAPSGPLLAALVEARGDDTLVEHAASLAALPGVGAPAAHAKKKTLFPDERESERVQRLRAEHQAEIVARVDPRDLGFVDESGCNRATTRLYARSLCGTRARGTAPRNWGDNVSVVSALSLGGIVETMHIPGAINGEASAFTSTTSFYPNFGRARSWSWTTWARTKLKRARAKLEAKGARLIYLPPYSPNLNPIELAWSKLKGFLRKKAARTTEALYVAIAEGLQTLTAQNAQAWFAHCGYTGLPN